MAPICATAVRALRAAGLVDVPATGCFPVGGVACDRLEAATVRMVRAELTAAELTDDAEIDRRRRRRARPHPRAADLGLGRSWKIGAAGATTIFQDLRTGPGLGADRCSPCPKIASMASAGRSDLALLRTVG